MATRDWLDRNRTPRGGAGSLFAFDRPKGHVEELSELAYSLALVLFMLMELRGLDRRAPTHPALRGGPGPG